MYLHTEITFTCPDGSKISVLKGYVNDKNFLKKQCSKFWPDDDCECTTPKYPTAMKLFAKFIVRNHFENTPKNLILLTKYHYRVLAAFMTIAMRHAENQRNNVTKNSMIIWKLSV